MDKKTQLIALLKELSTNVQDDIREAAYEGDQARRKELSDVDYHIDMILDYLEG